jgi:hypothetical protein
MKLDFICVGMYRAGTTWFHAIMQNHPRVILPYEKETMFFSHHYHRGIGWYANFFKGLRTDSLVGEICPTYLTHPFVAKRIYTHFPNAKIIMILREPIGQIKSLYKLWCIRGSTNLNINEALLQKEELLNNVMYYKNLKKYLDYFENQNIGIFFYDDLVKNPKQILANICRELKLDFSALENENFNRKINTSNKSVHPAIEIVVAKVGDYMRRHNLYKLRKLIKQTEIIDLFKIIPSKKELEPYQVILNYDSIQLICDRILPEVENLQRFVQRDLSHWVNRLSCKEKIVK